jgi:YfiH family protein
VTLEILTSDALSETHHGFFTRQGGASSGIFRGLNCGYGSSDQKEIVSINRMRVAQAMGVPDDHLVGVFQTHSPAVEVITEPGQKTGEADAMVTNVPGIALGILTADCQPVLFADPKAGVIGAAHAGWRGALEGVLDNTVNAMLKQGAKRENIRAVIGPSISRRAYEVGPEFLATFKDADPKNTRFFSVGQGDRHMFDLPAYGLHRLHQTGVGHAEWIGHCTYSDPNRFFSYRRTTHQNEADYGRLISVIRL